MKNRIKYILILLFGLLFSQGNFQILTIPNSTRMLSLSNAGHAMSDLSSNIYNVASLEPGNGININLHSHLYPSNILYFNTEAVLPFENFNYSFNYANLNYGEFIDSKSNYSFNSSEFLFRGTLKTHFANLISIGCSFNYAINKISNQFSHALMTSFGIRTQLDNPRFGLGVSMNNIGKILDHAYRMNENIPTSLSFSTFYSPKNFPGFLLLDIIQSNNIDTTQIRLGLEIQINNYILLRFGNSNSAFNLSDSYSSYFAGLSGGFGIQSNKWDIDIGFFNLESAGIVTGLSLTYKK